MGWTLALDTSTDVRVGLASADQVLVATVPDRMQHVEQLVPLVRGVLAEARITVAELESIIVGLGPGPFTGLRVGIASARILASVGQVPLHGITGLDVLARQAIDAAGSVEGGFVAATDARRKEVYWAGYDATGARTSGPAVDRPADLPDLPVIGPALDAYPDLPTLTGGPTMIDIGLMARIGASLPSAGEEPLYLRRPDATLPGAVKSVLPQVERAAR